MDLNHYNHSQRKCSICNLMTLHHRSKFCTHYRGVTELKHKQVIITDKNYALKKQWWRTLSNKRTVASVVCTSNTPHSDTQLHLTHQSIDFVRNHQRKRHHKGARREPRNVLSLTHTPYIHHLHMGRLLELDRLLTPT